MNYPKEIKAFYMRLNDDGKTVAAMDVLAPGIGEIIGGSQREERLDVLDARMAEMRPRPDALRVVPRPAPLRHGAARRLRPRLRAHGRLRHRAGEHPRRDPVPADAGERPVLGSPNAHGRIHCAREAFAGVPAVSGSFGRQSPWSFVVASCHPAVPAAAASRRASGRCRASLAPEYP